MSGGYFDYQNYLLRDFAEKIKYLINTNNSLDKNEFGDTIGRNYSPEVIEKFKEALEICLKADDMLHCIDYLVEDDYGEESFLREWKERLEK